MFHSSLLSRTPAFNFSSPCAVALRASLGGADGRATRTDAPSLAVIRGLDKVTNEEVKRGEAGGHQQIGHEHPDLKDVDQRENTGRDDDEQERDCKLDRERNDPLGRLVLAAAYCGRELLCRNEVDDPERKEVQSERCQVSGLSVNH